MTMTWPNQGAAANGLSAVRSSIAGIRERTVRSTAAPEAVAELGSLGRSLGSPSRRRWWRSGVDSVAVSSECAAPRRRQRESDGADRRRARWTRSRD